MTSLFISDEKTRIKAAIERTVAAGKRFVKVDSKKGHHSEFLDALEHVMNDDPRVRIHASYPYPERHQPSDGGVMLQLCLLGSD